MTQEIKNIEISHKVVGKNQPIFIIAEAGVNHNGQLEIAKKLVDAAVSAGADAVKFQTFKSERVVTKDVEIPEYAKKNIGKNMKQIDMIKNFELRYEDFIVLKKYCDNKNIIFLSSPHSFDAIDFLERLVPAYKFGSGDITNILALKHAAKKGKPMILGTGMSTIDEVKYAVNSIRSEGNNQIILLHCTTSYPCQFENANLRAIETMERELNCLVGYSDHTLGIIIPIMVATMGAVVLEKHFTIDKKLSGPDHKASLDPKELKEMILAVRSVEKSMGNGIKKPSSEEKIIKKIVRKSIVARVNIPKGNVITEEMLDVKRPESGISPVNLDNIIGKKTQKEIKKDEFITIEMIG